MNLRKLYLVNNQLSILPASIVNLINADIKLSGNPMIKRPPEGLYSRLFFGEILPSSAEYYKNIVPKYINGKYQLPTVYTVTASSGLSVRKEPSLKAKKIGSMPHRLKIAVYEESKNTESIDGITAPWVRIKAVANGKYMEGWAWAGYLEKYNKEKDYSLQFEKMINELIAQKTKPILDRERIQFYIQNGVDIDTKSLKSKRTLLSFVAHIGTIEDFRFLLANGASVQIKGEYGDSVASWVVIREDIGLKRKKEFLLALQDYGYELKWEGKRLLKAAIYSPQECGKKFVEEDINSEMLDFLKEQLDIKSVNEIMSDSELRSLRRC